MTTGAIVVSWGTPVPGREAKALEVFGRALQVSEAFTKEGKIHGHKEYVALTGNQQTMGGFQIFEGEVDKLLGLHLDERMRAIQAEAATIVENYTTQVFIGGSDAAVQSEMSFYAETLQRMGYGS